MRGSTVILTACYPGSWFCTKYLTLIQIAEVMVVLLWSFIVCKVTN